MAEQVELRLRSKSGRILHFFGSGTGAYLPLADVPHGQHPASVAIEHLYRRGGYRVPLEALKFEGTEERGGKKVHRYSVKATTGGQTAKPLVEMLWVAEPKKD